MSEKNSHWSVVRTRSFHVVVCAMLVAICPAALAQQPTKVPRIGFLITSSPEAIAPRMEAFQKGLRELGYVEGKNITIERRFANGKSDQLRSLADDLISVGVDVIVSSGPTATRPAKEATASIPIVMTFDDDPIGSGFVASLAGPGGNVTGLSTLSPEISGKQLELLKEIAPKIVRVAVIGTSRREGTSQNLKEMQAAAVVSRVKLHFLDTQTSKAIESSFSGASTGRADGIILLQSPVFNSHRREIAELAIKSRLPTIFPRSEFVQDGGLISYGVSILDLDRRASIYVDKIIKGVKPADLPVEQPTNFELVVNLKAAKQIGLTIPPSVLARADKVIK